MHMTGASGVISNASTILNVPRGFSSEKAKKQYSIISLSQWLEIRWQISFKNSLSKISYSWIYTKSNQ